MLVCITKKDLHLQCLLWDRSSTHLLWCDIIDEYREKVSVEGWLE